MFAERLKSLRREYKLNQGELANAIHVAQTTVSQWENNGKMPGIDMLIRIADYFDISTDYLLGRTEIKNEHIIKAPPELESAGVEKVAVSGRNQLTAAEIQAIRRLLDCNIRFFAKKISPAVWRGFSYVI